MIGHIDPAAATRQAEQEMIAQRKAAAARWPQLLEEIRQVPGFEHFALPPPMEAWHEAAGDEPCCDWPGTVPGAARR